MSSIQTYTAKSGQSIFDICLQVYGTLDLIMKLIQDNNIASLNSSGFTGFVFNYDASLIVDNSIVTANINIPYTTELYGNMGGSNGSYNSDYSNDYDN